MKEQLSTLDRRKAQHDQRRQILYNEITGARARRERFLAEGNARLVLRYEGMILRAEQALASLDRPDEFPNEVYQSTPDAAALNA